MRSRTSRGVPEWSGGEDLYMGSYHTVTGNVRGHTGIVPGATEGVPGIHREGPPVPEGLMGCRGKGTSPLEGWAPPPRAHAPRVGGNPKALFGCV